MEQIKFQFHSLCHLSLFLVTISNPRTSPQKQHHGTVYCFSPTWPIDDTGRFPQVAQQNICDSFSSMHRYCRESSGHPSHTAKGEKNNTFYPASHLYVVLWSIAVLFVLLLTPHGNLCRLCLMSLSSASLEWNLGGQEPVSAGTNRTTRLPRSSWNRDWWWRRSYSLYDLSQQVGNQGPVKSTAWEDLNTPQFTCCKYIMHN